jgi:RimJ/RimL family protein N-acetyltransferase
MGERPTIQTERLLLRPLRLEDAEPVRLLAGAREIAAQTLSIPHPYEAGLAEQWISSQPEAFEKGEAVTFAVTLRQTGELVGAAGLILCAKDQNAELGYWIGVPYWRRGYATEAARSVVAFGFSALGLHRIHAGVFSGNRASARVLKKIGMRREGRLPHHHLKWGRFLDLDRYGILEADWRREREHEKEGVPEADEGPPVEIPIDGTLDLHTFRPGDVGDLVPEYLARCGEKGILRVRVIHGKGEGVLLRTVHALLGRLPNVGTFSLAGPLEGGSGATIVRLKPADRGEPAEGGS